MNGVAVAIVVSVTTTVTREAENGVASTVVVRKAVTTSVTKMVVEDDVKVAEVEEGARAVLSN